MFDVNSFVHAGIVAGGTGAGSFWELPEDIPDEDI